MDLVAFTDEGYYSLSNLMYVGPCIIVIAHHHHHHHKHKKLDPLIRSVSRVTVARANASSVFQLFSFLVVCSGMISKGFGFVAFLCKCESQFRLYSSILSSRPVIRSSRRM